MPMMGERDPQASIWGYRVNLDKRVRSDHPLRRINEVLDLSFVRGQVAHTYGRRGNKSVRLGNQGRRRHPMRSWDSPRFFLVSNKSIMRRITSGGSVERHSSFKTWSRLGVGDRLRGSHLDQDQVSLS